MLVFLLILVSLGLLIHGMVAGQAMEVLAAGCLSLVTIAVVIGERWLSSRAATEDEEPEAGPSVAVLATSAVAPELDAAEVVFVAGRTMFHALTCPSVADRAVSRADRTELERGGMKPCRRCLPAGENP